MRPRRSFHFPTVFRSDHHGESFNAKTPKKSKTAVFDVFCQLGHSGAQTKSDSKFSLGKNYPQTMLKKIGYVREPTSNIFCGILLIQKSRFWFCWWKNTKNRNYLENQKHLDLETTINRFFGTFWVRKHAFEDTVAYYRFLVTPAVL